MFQENQTISLVLQTALGQYLDYIAAYPERIDRSIQVRARMGADILAAMSQFSQSALNCFDEHETEPQPLSVFALIRSTLYGLQYLDSLEEIESGKEITKITRIISKSSSSYAKSNVVSTLGEIHPQIDDYEQWRRLSEFVHIIPAIDKHGGSNFNRVNFQYPRDLSSPSIHAGLPEQFSVEARRCLDWQAKICVGFLLKFRNIYPYFFNFRSPILSKQFNEEVLHEFREYIQNIPTEENISAVLKNLANALFESGNEP